MLERLERQKKLTANQWRIILTTNLGDMLDFFDFFLIGYVLAFVLKEWHITYGQSAIILISVGVGAVPGAFFWGWMGDRIGRRASGECRSTQRGGNPSARCDFDVNNAWAAGACAATRGEEAGRHRFSLERRREKGEVNAVLRIRREFEGPEAECLQHVEQPEIGRRFDRDRVAGPGDRRDLRLHRCISVVSSGE